MAQCACHASVSVPKANLNSLNQFKSIRVINIRKSSSRMHTNINTSLSTIVLSTTSFQRQQQYEQNKRDIQADTHSHTHTSIHLYKSEKNNIQTKEMN